MTGTRSAAGIKNIHPGNSDAQEWYRTTPEEARRIAEATLAGYSPNSSPGNYVLRDEQGLFIANALDAWIGGASKRLWDAKMRFGKTLTALEFVGQARQAELQQRSNGRRMSKLPADIRPSFT